MGASLTTFTRRHPHSQHLRSVTAARGQRLPASGPRADTHKTPQPLSRPCGPAAQSTRPRSSLRLAPGSGSFSEFVGLGSGTMTWCSHCRSAAGCVPCGRRKTLESNRRRGHLASADGRAPLPGGSSDAGGGPTAGPPPRRRCWAGGRGPARGSLFF